MLFGVVVGVVLSLGWLIYVTTRPPMPLLDSASPGIAVLRLDGGLFFATAEALEDRIRELDEAALVLDLEGVNFIDSQGAAKLREIHQLTELRLARVKPQVLAVLRADGVVDLVGEDHIHDSVHHAVDAARALPAAGGRETP